ncbi:unnamed protein product [Sympodiomycopsis kandeliae]
MVFSSGRRVWTVLVTLSILATLAVASSRSKNLIVHFARDGNTTASLQENLNRWASVPDYDSFATIYSGDSEPNLSVTTSDETELVWITREVVDVELEERIKGGQRWFVQDIGSQAELKQGEYLDTENQSKKDLSGVEILQEYQHSALLQVDSRLLPTLDHYLSPFTRPYLLSSSSLRDKEAPKDTYTFPEPSSSPFLSSLSHSSHWSTSSLRKTALTLTGEDQSEVKQGWTTRHSATAGCLRAGNWILSQAEEALQGISGAQCELEDYLEGQFAPNVVCVIPSHHGKKSKVEWQYKKGVKPHKYDHKEAVLLSAHYDSRGSFGNPDAPGGDDDGSGSTMLLAITRILGDAVRAEQHSHEGYRRREIQLVWFSGEEEGLVGSHYYATALSKSQSTHHSFIPARQNHLRLMIQTDMIAYHSVNSEPLQIAFPDKLSTNSATSYLWSISSLYSPELTRGYTPACCSDHQSFWEANFPSTWVFERNGPILDPKYHNSGDLVNRENYDFDQLKAIGRVVLVGAAGLIWE